MITSKLPDVFAKLPVRHDGLPFCVDADWLLSASREDIHKCSWNLALRSMISDVFVRAVREDFVANRAIALQ